MHDKIIDPNAPAIVLFGLILVNFGPLIDLPITKPPTSDAIHPKSKVKINIFNHFKFLLVDVHHQL